MKQIARFSKEYKVENQTEEKHYNSDDNNLRTVIILPYGED